MAKLPAFQFYPGDWRKDPGLARCSKAAKGVLMDLLCLMFECPERGVLATDGVPWPDDEVAAAIGGDCAENQRCIDELLAKGVLSRNNAGALLSRRMVRDEQKRGQDAARKRKQRGSHGDVTPDVTPSVTPMSRRSSSSSSPSGFERESGAGASDRRDGEPLPSAGPGGWYELIREAFPKSAPGTGGRAAVAAAVSVLADREGLSTAEAGRRLLGLVRAYAASPLVASTPEQFRPSMAKWLRDGGYDDEAEWARERAASAPPPGASGPAGVLAAIESRRERADRRDAS